MTTHCCIQTCKNSSLYTNLHPCPTTSEMRNKWLHVLKNKCSFLDWSKSKICSKHFENKYFDGEGNLKNNAIPTLFSSTQTKIIRKSPPPSKMRNKIDRLLGQLTQSELSIDLRNTLGSMREPVNLSDFVYEDLKHKPDIPLEAKLWLIIKKQEHLNSRLMDTISKNRQNIQSLQKSVDDSKHDHKELTRNIESYKYIVKSLQEKNATLEEQVEILSTVESR